MLGRREFVLFVSFGLYVTQGSLDMSNRKMKRAAFFLYNNLKHCGEGANEEAKSTEEPVMVCVLVRFFGAFAWFWVVHNQSQHFLCALENPMIVLSEQEG
jgi:hypothetical protein